tara:strand:+ start:1777 stop:1953 length:177 start_codon:yes stop_codon:yes gene_type:complete
MKDWKDKRIDAMNRKIKNFKYSKRIITEHYIDEYDLVLRSKAKSKKEFKQERKTNEEK